MPALHGAAVIMFSKTGRRPAEETTMKRTRTILLATLAATGVAVAVAATAGPRYGGCQQGYGPGDGPMMQGEGYGPGSGKPGRLEQGRHDPLSKSGVSMDCRCHDEADLEFGPCFNMDVICELKILCGRQVLYGWHQVVMGEES